MGDFMPVERCRYSDVGLPLQRYSLTLTLYPEYRERESEATQRCEPKLG
jgi:hypothetical protein